MFTFPKVLFFILIVTVFSLSNKTLASEKNILTQKRAWAISMDNDLFSPTSKTDADFTGGFSFSYSGDVIGTSHKTLDKGLGKIDGLILGSGRNNLQAHGIEIGLYGFTPNEVESYNILFNDRPYASLLYVSSSRSYNSTVSDSAWSTSLSVGVLGLGWFGSAQNSIHNALGSKPANGWRNQVSDGGELTFRYQVAYMDYWSIGKKPTTPKIKATYFSSTGYITEVGVSISSTSSITSSIGSRFNPELISYGEKVNDIALAAGASTESYFWGGVSLKARAYNAFLQGQFRRSVHTLNRNQLEPLLFEAWIGYTYSMTYDYKLSYVLRGQTSEVKNSEGRRNLFWGALVLSHSLKHRT